MANISQVENIMQDIEFYEKNVRILGIDFYEFIERLAIKIEDEPDANDKIKNQVLFELKNEQLARLGMRKIIKN